MNGCTVEKAKDKTILRAILSSLCVGIVIIDCQEKVVEINPFAEKLFNINRDKAIGKRFSTVVPGSPLADVLETRKEIGPMFECRSGKYLLSHHYPLLVSSKLKGAFSTYLDVTEQEQTKMRLQDALQKEKELEAILEYSHDGLWIMDGAGITLRVSKSWQNFSGIDREEVIGRSVYEIVAEGYYTDSAAIHVIEQRKPATIIYKTKTGKKALVTATPVFGEDGNIWRIISNVRDITELDQYRRELEESHKINLRFREELKFLRQQHLESTGIIARSRAMHDILEVAAQTAGSDATILILGESGVGKDMVARFIHNTSNRKEGPFIRVNCSAIPETLIESELFGYEEGSFTGARKKGKPGMFELAQGGTLFLDEIGELPIQMQAKLLHVLQDHSIMRVGGVKPINVDVRIIAATNQDLKSMVEEGRFRKDLYYRLNVIPIHIPPLRERPDDIIPLLMYFLDKYNQKYQMNKSFSSEALKLLVKYEWPGNVRELENIAERLILTCPTDSIDKKDLPAFIKEKSAEDKNAIPLKDFNFSQVGSLKQAKEEIEKSLLSWALARYGSTRKVASALGVAQPTVVRLAHKYGLHKGGSLT